MPCRHCGRICILVGRALCKACHALPRIRNRYPVLRASTSSKGVDFYRAALPADSPTDARPGSEEKIAVLAERAAQKRELWHPDDGASRMRDH